MDHSDALKEVAKAAFEYVTHELADDWTQIHEGSALYPLIVALRRAGYEPSDGEWARG